MSMASVNLVGWVNSPSIPLFRIALRSLRSPLTAISGEVKPNFAKGVQLRWPIKATSTNELPGGFANRQLELTVKNVDLVLEDVRPYLVADGGNVDVVSVEDGIIYLELQEACGSCPSSTTTMKMGIERVLKEKLVMQSRMFNKLTAVNRHLDILRPAIKNYGGEVNVIALVGGDCSVRYEGPHNIGLGIKAAVKERFPDIVNVVFTE